MTSVTATELWAEVDGGRMRYLRTPGDSFMPPLLLIHGLWGYAFSWRRNIDVLAQRSTVYAVDMLGAGYSDRPNGTEFDWSLRGHARRLLQFMDQTGIAVADVAASSHGGAIAMMLAIEGRALRRQNAAGGSSEGQNRVRRLALVSPVNPWSHYNNGSLTFAENPAAAALVALARPLTRVLCKWSLQRIYGRPERIPPDAIAGYSAPLMLRRSAHTQIGILRAWRRDEGELKRLLPLISDLQVLFIWGSEDRVISLADSAELIENFPGAAVITIPGAGHMPYEEMPEEFNATLLRFLSAKNLADVSMS